MARAGTRVHAVDAACWVIAAALGAAAGAQPAGAGQLVSAMGASMALTLAIGRPLCRGHTRSTIASATWSAEREREHARFAAAHNRATFRAIVDTATEGIVTIDAAGQIETINGAAERMFGYQPGELVGRDVRLLMPEPYRGEHEGYVSRYLETREPRIIGIGREVTGIRKDGSTLPIDLSVGEGEIEGRTFFTAIIRDLTERKELRAKLAQAERLAAVGELAAGVAHEINNPVNTMINCAQLIQDGEDPTEDCKIIIEEGGRITDIVSALLQFARDDQDRAQPTALDEVVERTRRLIGESWKRHGITLTLDVPDDLPAVHARPQKVQQVLLNLLINAKDALSHHHAATRRVTVTASPRDGGVAFEVTDNGPGIDPEVRDRVFEPFVTTKRGRGGTGLGLSISQGIVEGYGGKLRFEDVPEGGTRFTVWLPLAPTE